MKSAVIQLHDVQLRGVSCGKFVEKQLKTIAVQVGKQQKKTFARQRLDRPISVQRFERPLHHTPGFNPERGDHPMCQRF